MNNENSSNTTANTAENNQNQTTQQQTVNKNVNESVQSQTEEIKSVERIGEIIANETNWRSVLRDAAKRESGLVKENDSLHIENKRLRDELRAYNDLNLLASQGFNANMYDDIRKLCDGNITEDRLKELKKKRDYTFLLERVRGVDTSQMGKPEKDLWSKWLTEEAQSA